MKLDGVYLENVGLFNKFEIEFKNRLSLITGDNGMGKTTLFSAIASVYPMFFGFNAETFPRTRSGENESTIALKFANSQFSDYLLKYSFLVTARRFRQIDQSVNTEPIVPLIPLNAHRKFIRDFEVSGPVSEHKPDKKRLLYDIAYLFEDFDDPSIHRWLVNRHFKSEELIDKIAKKEIESLYQAVEILFPDHHDIAFRTIDHAMQPVFHTRFGDTPFHLLSSGAESIMAIAYRIIATFCMFYTESENIFAEEAVIIIDEIESHLHPTWQKIIVQSLTRLFTNCQFIITTHSPLVIESFEGDIFELTEKNKSIDAKIINV